MNFLRRLIKSGMLSVAPVPSRRMAKAARRATMFTAVCATLCGALIAAPLPGWAISLNFSSTSIDANPHTLSAGNNTVEVSPNVTGTFGALISGTGTGAETMQKTGAGTLVFNIANTTADSFVLDIMGGSVKSGVSQVYNALNTAAGTTFSITAGAQDLTVSGGTLAGAIDGMANFNKTGSGSLNLNVANAISVLSNGTVNLSGGTVSAAAEQDFRKLTLASGAALNMGGNALKVEGGSIAGALSNVEELVLTANNTLTLDVANALSGVTTVHAENFGIIQANADQKIQALNTGNSGTGIGKYDMNGHSLEITGTGTSTSTFYTALDNSGTGGGFTKSGSGSLVLAVDDALANAASVNLAAGSTRVDAAKSNTQTMNNLTLGADATLDMASKDLTLDGVNVVNGTLSNTGALDVATGSLTISKDNQVQAATASFGDNTTFNLTPSAQSSALKTTGAIAFGNNAAVSVGALSGLSEYVVMEAGSFTGLPAGMTYTGALPTATLDRYMTGVSPSLSADGKTLKAVADLSWNSTAAGLAHGTFNIVSGDSFEVVSALSDNADTTAFYSGWDGKTLSKTGEGTLLLSSAGNGYTGATNVNAGTLGLSGAGSIASSSGVNVASGATFDISKLNDGVNGHVKSLDGSGSVALGTRTLEAEAGSFGGVISGSSVDGGLTKTGAGALSLSGVNTYFGATNVNAGTLALAGNGSILNSSGLNVAQGATFDISASSNSTNTVRSITGAGDVALGANNLQVAADSKLDGVASGTGGLALNTAGTRLELTGANTYTGWTNIAKGIVALTGAGSIASSQLKVSDTFDISGISAASTAVAGLNGAGQVLLGGKTLQVNNTADSVFEGVIGGAGGLVKSGTGTLALTGTNTYTGGTQVDGGILSLYSPTNVIGLITTGANGVLNLPFAGTFSNALAGAGSITNNVAGDLTYNGDASAFTGTWFTNAGSFTLNNAVSGPAFGGGVTVANATFGGNAIIGGRLTANSGGIVSPGNSIGTITVRDLTFNKGSYYDVELEPANNGGSDLIRVTNTATLNGGTVRHIGLNDSFRHYEDRTWTILSVDAGGALTGMFDGVEPLSAFYDTSLSYTSNSVLLGIARSNVIFEDFAQNEQQRSLAYGLSSAEGSPLTNVLMTLPYGVNYADIYDQLNGEMYSGISTAILDRDRAFTSELRHRLWGDQTSGAYAPLGPFPFWVSVGGYAASADKTPDTASADQTGFDVSVGGEVRITDIWKAGAALRYSYSDYDVDSRHSSANIHSYTGALYTGADIPAGPGEVRLFLGGTFGFHDVGADRHLRFYGDAEVLNQNLSTDYDARSGQVAAEIGYRIPVVEFRFDLEPYIGGAWNIVHIDDFKEDGGYAALNSKSVTNDNVSSSVGLRAAFNFNEWARAEGDVSWLHTYGDLKHRSDFAFAGGQYFGIVGAPLSRDAASVYLGGNFRVTEQFGIRAGYTGVFGDKTMSNGGNLLLEYAF